MTYINSHEIITSVMLYLVVHAIVDILVRCAKFVLKCFQTERDHIVRKHVKGGHQVRLKHCVTGECATLETQTTGQVL